MARSYALLQAVLLAGPPSCPRWQQKVLGAGAAAKQRAAGLIMSVKAGRARHRGVLGLATYPSVSAAISTPSLYLSAMTDVPVT